jgi:hypothetical protein
VAGYLFGLSGEMAVKAMMRDSGMKPFPNDRRRDDPFYAHFPEIKLLLKNTLSGRRSGELRKIAEASALFLNWDTDMRYAPTDDIASAWIELWKTSAQDLVNRIDLL